MHVFNSHAHQLISIHAQQTLGSDLSSDFITYILFHSPKTTSSLQNENRNGHKLKNGFLEGWFRINTQQCCSMAYFSMKIAFFEFVFCTPANSQTDWLPAEIHCQVTRLFSRFCHFLMIYTKHMVRVYVVFCTTLLLLSINIASTRSIRVRIRCIEC